MKQYNVSQICSLYDDRTTMSKISMYDGTKRYYQQVKHQQKWSWEDCTSWRYDILCSFTLYWLLHDQEDCSKQWTAELYKIEDICKTPHWPNDEFSKLQSPKWNSGERSRNQESKRKESLRWWGQWENAISGKQMDSAQEETLLVSATEVIVDKEHNRPLFLRIRRPRLTERERYPQKVQATEEKAFQTKGA